MTISRLYVFLGWKATLTKCHLALTNYSHFHPFRKLRAKKLMGDQDVLCEEIVPLVEGVWCVMMSLPPLFTKLGNFFLNIISVVIVFVLLLGIE